MTSAETNHVDLSKARRTALILGVVGLAVTFIGLRNPAQFFRSYIFAYTFWVMLPIGCLALLMTHHLTGGKWGIPVRRLLEAGSNTFPLMAVLFIPIFFGMKELYPWARPEDVASDPILQYKQPYLNVHGYVVRTIVYFAFFLIFSTLLNRWAKEYDVTLDRRLLSRCGRLSGPGLVFWSLVLTGASIDWVMSLEPHWFSTIYGMIFMMIATLTAMSLMAFIGTRIFKTESLSTFVTPLHWNDVGNLMLAFVMLWTYLSFDQFLIIWSGNLKNEIPWYVSRANGGWAGVALILVLFQFAIPFLLLLQRGITRRSGLLALVAVGLFFVNMVDVYWYVVPAYYPQSPMPHVTDITGLIGIGGLWIGAFLWRLGSRSLVPIHGGSFEEVAAHGD
jgi:hypothetical protein